MTKNEMRGALFQNKNKVDKQPDFKGDFKLNGVNYRLAGWKTPAADGTYIALKIEEFKQEIVDDLGLDDDIPM